MKTKKHLLKCSCCSSQYDRSELVRCPKGLFCKDCYQFVYEHQEQEPEQPKEEP